MINPSKGIQFIIYSFGLLASLSWFFIDFISSHFWQENFIYSFIFFLLLITFFYFQIFRITGWKTQLSPNSSGTLTILFFGSITVLMIFLASYSIAKKTVPWIYTRLNGQPAELILTAQKISFTGRKGCHTYLYFRADNENKICIRSSQDKYPDTEFKAKLIGKQSKLGFLVQSIEVAEQP
ncbi:hypothetical protein [Alkanindiges illinoisensis]|uniref:Uncharacterized protein n=1 Tax=Alkanindiges illinoisensis TaxID=197183 RepID=A0A4Y7XE60_9GAMM|nr:hypothetical protein [Alkanindiges illinoisensis]TEU29353.1 hypothetical protein E2B99_04660 [Alkanindiges illinoisensis]